jgi:hypothetical protein
MPAWAALVKVTTAAHVRMCTRVAIVDLQIVVQGRCIIVAMSTLALTCLPARAIRLRIMTRSTAKATGEQQNKSPKRWP